MMSQNVGGNALKLAGEIFLPGASQLLSGNIKSGLVHTALGIAAGVALVGTGVAPVMGTLAIIGVKLNSYASSVSGDGLWSIGSEAVGRRAEPTPEAPTRAGRADTPSRPGASS
jgi:hypothetical protein